MFEVLYIRMSCLTVYQKPTHAQICLTIVWWQRKEKPVLEKEQNVSPIHITTISFTKNAGQS
jgi:hypothetical protein